MKKTEALFYLYQFHSFTKERVLELADENQKDELSNLIDEYEANKDLQEF